MRIPEATLPPSTSSLVYVQQLDQARNVEMKATLTKIGTTLDGIADTLNAMGEHQLGASAEKAAEEVK